MVFCTIPSLVEKGLNRFLEVRCCESMPVAKTPVDKDLLVLFAICATTLKKCVRKSYPYKSFYFIGVCNVSFVFFIFHFWLCF